MENKEKIMKALKACSEYYCCECPYQHLDDSNVPLRCIHTLVEDVYELFKRKLDDKIINGDRYE